MNDLEWFDTKGMLNEYDKMRKETYINETNKIRNQLRYRIKCCVFIYTFIYIFVFLYL